MCDRTMTIPYVKRSSILHRVIPVVVQVVRKMVEMVRGNTSSGDFSLVRN